MKLITIEHDDSTELTVDEAQTCYECGQSYDLYKLIISCDQDYYECVYVECPHCESETVIYTY